MYLDSDALTVYNAGSDVFAQWEDRVFYATFMGEFPIVKEPSLLKPIVPPQRIRNCSIRDGVGRASDVTFPFVEEGLPLPWLVVYTYAGLVGRLKTVVAVFDTRPLTGKGGDIEVLWDKPNGIFNLNAIRKSEEYQNG